MLKINLSKTAFLFPILFILSIPFSVTVKAQTVDTVQQTIFVLPSLDGIGSLEHQPTDSISAVPEKASLVEAPKIRLNPKAVGFVNNYLKSNEELLVSIKSRSTPYFKIIESLLLKNDLPLELKYLAVIESKLKSNAVSHAGAAGPWQIMPATARSLGLKITAKRDDRKDYYKSTVAVCKYIKELYAMYGDWLLVIASYNAGPGNVNKAIKKSGSRNFWYLQYHLPAETRAHVKRFIGAHYFFEQRGSETTLTKAEAVAFRKTLSEFKEKQEKTRLDETVEKIED